MKLNPFKIGKKTLESSKLINHQVKKTIPGADLIGEVLAKTDEETASMPPVNIMLIGKTGVGKSTLINNIFRENLASTGIGEPVTEHLQKLSKEGVPITLYDTKGLELSHESQVKVKEEIQGEIRRLEKLGEREKIHAIWFCINASANRIEAVEADWIKSLGETLPVILVLTLSVHNDSSIELQKYIAGMNLPIAGIVRVLAENFQFGPFTVNAFGLKELVRLTYDSLPEAAGYSFINAQKVDIDKKAEIATRWAKRFIYETFLVGFVPIPFADAPIISASQVAMIAKITSIFGVTYDKAMVTAVITGTAGIGGAVVSGRWLVTNLLKFIPGAGALATGMISGSTAAAITSAMAYAYINVMKKVAGEEYRGKKLLPEEITALMKTELKKYRNKSSDFEPGNPGAGKPSGKPFPSGGKGESNAGDGDSFVFRDKQGNPIQGE